MDSDTPADEAAPRCSRCGKRVAPNEAIWLRGMVRYEDDGRVIERSYAYHPDCANAAPEWEI